MGDGPEAIVDPLELRAVRMRAASVTAMAVAGGLLAAGVFLVLPG